MKKFFSWFKNSTRIKRWMFLILIGIVLTCFGISKILTSEQLDIKNLILVIATFVAGFILFVIGIVFIQKRNLEILIENNKLNANANNNSDVKNLISKSIYEKGPNIVVIGGGNGINNILRGLKNYTSNLTAIVPVSSYGRPSTISIKELNLHPVEDIKNSIIALSENTEEMESLINYTFDEGKLKDLSYGDLYLYVMQKIYGDFTRSIKKASGTLSMVGQVLPVTMDEMNICAELQDGTEITEKSKIKEIVANKVTKINRVYLNPTNCRTAPGVIEALQNADAIIIGPGSLYTNVIPNLLIKNVSKTIRESKALKIYISNIMTEPGQTEDYDVSDHIQSILDHSGKGIIDYCIADIGQIVPEFIRKYNLLGSDIVNIDTQKIKEKGIRLIKGELASIDKDKIIHDPDKTAKLIIELICTDLRFKDEHNSEQYALLNSHLKDEKEKEKFEKKLEKKKEKEQKEKKSEGKHSIQKEKARKDSKFSSKYKDRILSIKESDNTRLKNIEEAEKKEKEEFLKETYNNKNKKK